MIDEDLWSIIQSYVGSAMSRGMLQDIRRSAMQRQIRQRRYTNFLHYDLQGHLLTAIFLTRVCRCRNIVCCSRPSCYLGRNIVGFVTMYVNRRTSLQITYREL